MVEQQFDSVDDYIGSFPLDVQPVLTELRLTIMAASPAATVEGISYHMPTYTIDGERLVFFAGWKTHVALYAIPAFEGELESVVAPYRASKDTLKFSLKKPVPFDLVARVVKQLAPLRS